MHKHTEEKSLTMNGSLRAKLEGTADAKMEHSPAKYELVMVLVVNGVACERSAMEHGALPPPSPPRS